MGKYFLSTHRDFVNKSRFRLVSVHVLQLELEIVVVVLTASAFKTYYDHDPWRAFELLILSPPCGCHVNAPSIRGNVIRNPMFLCYKQHSMLTHEMTLASALVYDSQAGPKLQLGQ